MWLVGSGVRLYLPHKCVQLQERHLLFKSLTVEFCSNSATLGEVGGGPSEPCALSHLPIAIPLFPGMLRLHITA